MSGYFRISSNRFGGFLPSECGRWSNLYRFSADRDPNTALGDGGLEGAVPSQLGGLTNAGYFEVSHTVIFLRSAPVAPSPPSLSRPQVRHNSITSSLPTELGGLEVNNLFDIAVRFTTNPSSRTLTQ